MQRPRKRFAARDRRLQILAVAGDLFSRQGFAGTTTKQIAHRAGVNEALIFRHFPAKDELYWAVIEQKCLTARRREELQELLATDASDEQHFARLAQEILQRNTEDGTLLRLLLFSALENHRLSSRFYRTRVAKYFDVLAAHIRRRVRQGRFRHVDPHLAARGFLGMVIYYYLIQELFGGKRYRRLDPERASEVFAEIWLRGMQTPQKQNGRPTQKKK